jgi:hypothetical protein
MEDRIGAYRVLVGRSEGRRPLGTRMQIWKDKRGLSINSMGDSIDLAQHMGQTAGCCEQGDESSGPIK